MLQPGPLHAFYERTKARRGHGKAIVATARKLAVLFWCMLTRGEDYAHQQPSLTRKKLRRLEITAGAPKNTRRAAGIWSTNDLMRTAERELARQAEASYKRMVQDQLAGRAGEERWARARHRSAHRFKSLKRGHKSRGRPGSRRLLFATSFTRAHQQPTPQPPRWQDQGDHRRTANTDNTDLTFIGRSKGLSAQLHFSSCRTAAFSCKQRSHRAGSSLLRLARGRVRFASDEGPASLWRRRCRR